MRKDENELTDTTTEVFEAAARPMRRGWILLALMMTMMLAAMDNTIVSVSYTHLDVYKRQAQRAIVILSSTRVPPAPTMRPSRRPRVRPMP